MSNENPTRPAASDDEKSVGSGGTAPTGPRQGGTDPRMGQALDTIGVDDQGDGPSFIDDVRSDSGDDEARERR